MHVINIPQMKFLKMIVQIKILGYKVFFFFLNNWEKIFSHLIINYALNE